MRLNDDPVTFTGTVIVETSPLAGEVFAMEVGDTSSVWSLADAREIAEDDGTAFVRVVVDGCWSTVAAEGALRDGARMVVLGPL